MQQRLMVYVDGFNLYHGLRSKHGHKMLWLDLVQLAQVLRPYSTLRRVKYFTADVLDEPAALSRQHLYQRAMTAAHPGLIEIVQGRYQRKDVTCRNCGQVRNVYEEKETDVNIAVSLVADAALDLMDTAMIISADSDLVPAVRTVQRIMPKLTIFAAFPPKRFSNELQTLMPSSFSIGTGRLNASLLPRVVVDGQSGQPYERPAKWY